VKAKEILSRYRRARAVQARAYEALDAHLSGMYEFKGSLNERVSGSAYPDKLADLVVGLEERIEAAENAILDGHDAFVAAERLINRLHSDQQRVVLIERYLLFRSWQEVAEDLDMTRSNVRTVHQRALDALDGLLAAQALDDR
jgi:DNA-directed RNA polymerase specialized sigma24 family protein